nr:unnamed protein product [Callosobruchus chinensis]
MDAYTIGEPDKSIRSQSKIIAEKEASYSVTLMNRIMDMKQHIATLKKRISDERTMLEREKSEIYGSYNSDDKNQVSTFNQSYSLSCYGNSATDQKFVTVPEDRLEYIHQKCDVELLQPHRCVASTRDCKEQWKNIKFTNLGEPRSDIGDETEEDVISCVLSSGDRS